MCGKPNPEDLDVCQFCEARLSPFEDPDTSSLLPGQTPSEKDTSELEKTLPTWLQDARKEIGEDEQDDENDEWLKNIQENAGEKETKTKRSSEAERDLPDWLSDLDDEYSQSDEEKEPEKNEEELPDWLLELGKEGDIEEELLSQAEDVPDWIKEGSEKPVGKEVPDWFFDDVEKRRPVEEDAFTEEDALGLEDLEEEPLEEADMPNWFSEIAEGKPVEEDAFTEEDALGLEDLEEEPLEEADMPDWFSEIAEGKPVEEDAFTEEDVLGLEDLEEEPLEEADMPDWFSEIAEGKPVEEDAFTEEDALGLEDLEEEPLPQEDKPDWLLEEAPSEETALASADKETEKANVQPFHLEDDEEEDLFEGELPEWLTAAAVEEGIEEGQEMEIPQDLSSSELPGWVEAMRPVTTTPDEELLAQDIEEEYVENSGPLAGITNVLPTGADIDQLQEVSKTSYKLQITPQQEKFSALLEDLVDEEGTSKAITGPARISTQRVLWWIIAVVLLLFVGTTIQYGSGQFPYPLHYKENLALNQSIQALPENAPVLVAIEYEPALSGEMKAVTTGVFDHLILNGAYLTFISTSPTGPALAENFLDTMPIEHQYSHGQQYVNLGYLPGNSAGLLSFVIAPREIMPLAFDGTDAWETKPLQGIERISDFSLVLVVTDDPDTARLWVEQVQPHLIDTPLGIVASAQAGPLIRPYYEVSPRQVSGIVAGIRDGVAYEELNGRGNQAQAYWDAFNLGVAATFLALLLGGIVNIIAGFSDKNKANKHEERT